MDKYQLYKVHTNGIDIIMDVNVLNTDHITRIQITLKRVSGKKKKLILFSTQILQYL